MAITINNDRHSLEIARGEQVMRWEYDVLTLKLEAERLEIQHKLKAVGDKPPKPPTAEFLIDFAACLIVHGLEGCSIDTAFRVYSLVTVQFAQLARSLESQLTELEKK